MLVLNRRVGGVVHIGPDIQVQVLRCDGQTVRLGFTAPNDVPVVREELLDDDGNIPDSLVKSKCTDTREVELEV